MAEFYLGENLVFLHMTGTCEDILREMAENLVKEDLVETSFVSGIMEREKDYPTGLPTNSSISVAIPHTDIEHVKKNAISVAVLKEPAAFRVMGEASMETPVSIIFMLAMKESHAQLSLLKDLMTFLQDEGTLRDLYDSKTKEEVVQLIDRKLSLTASKGGDR
ncbi:PTS system, galactitol-specific IIA component [Terribacillus halophilus]|uniref:PTS system, galactitol-specific IIA component n=1 Tax=Terribacillus halophilus TaxID=361279 RepID=A0A1G6UA31_9BACI|nr:PTS sugar transporter subunit IIA [Terribacillus halophilus]SDD38173.1 PTS system, galactitol-specific IIA component [Terribacillus halophilus]